MMAYSEVETTVELTDQSKVVRRGDCSAAASDLHMAVLMGNSKAVVKVVAKVVHSADRMAAERD
jgi:hypothetical protein